MARDHVEYKLQDPERPSRKALREQNPQLLSLDYRILHPGPFCHNRALAQIASVEES